MSDFGNYVYGRIVDYIKARARTNEVREEYAHYMAEQRFNNNEMAELSDIIISVADREARKARSDREEDEIIDQVVQTITDYHTGFYAMSDRRIIDAVDDRMYSELNRAAEKWQDIIDQIEGRSRYDRGRGGESRPVGSARRSVRDTRRSEPESRRSMGSIFDARTGSGDRGGDPRPERARRTSFPSREAVMGGSDRPTRPAPEDIRQRDREGRRPMARDRGQEVPQGSTRHDRGRVYPTPQGEVEDGPDMTKERPYDDFWMGGEHWQIAHRSEFVWTWTPEQQTRRSYFPDQEVCFLVKGVDGTVREEFVPMTDDLLESAHEIRQQNRPFMRRPHVDNLDNGDDIFESNDLDVVGPTVLDDKTRRALVAHAFEQFKAQRKHLKKDTVIVSGDHESVVRVTAESIKTDEHVTGIPTMKSVLMIGDETTRQAMTAVAKIGSEGGDLGTLRRRLVTLKGEISENIMRYFDAHYTKEINNALSEQFGLVGLEMDSFLTDFDDLLECNRFKAMGAGYAKQFLQRTKPLMGTLGFTTDIEEQRDILDASDILPISEGDPEAYLAFRDNTILIFETGAWLHLKLNSEDLGMVDDSVRVPGKTGGDQLALRSLLCDLYATGRTLTAGHVYVVTADHLTYELIPISGARDIVGIKSINPV